MGLTALGKADEKNTGKMGKILEKLMKKYWKNVKNTGKVYEKILEKCKKNWKSQGNSSVQKSGNHGTVLRHSNTFLQKPADLRVVRHCTPLKNHSLA